MEGRERDVRTDHLGTPVGKAPDTWVVVPAYNEAPVIREVIAGLRQSFGQIVCVDDASTDDCASIAAEAGAVVLRHPVNLGQGAALQTGIKYALRFSSTKFIVTFDADGQHRVRDALGMLQLARSQSVDVVLGSRFLEGCPTMPWSRRAALRGAVIFTMLTSRLRLTDAHNGLRVLSRRAASAVDIRLHRMAHASELLGIISQNHFAFTEYPVSVDYSEYSMAKGQSNLNALNIVFDLVMQRLRAAQ